MIAYVSCAQLFVPATMGFALATLAQVSDFDSGEAEPSAKLEQHFEQYCLGLVPTHRQMALPCG